MRYKTPAALEMAVKEAAKKSPLDANRAIAGFYFHRLLCRVFSDPDSPFVLKGGQSVLARTVDARATRDIDLLARETSVEAAVTDLRRLAGIGLDDFISFSFDKAEPIKADDEYRSEMKVWFTPSLSVASPCKPCPSTSWSTRSTGWNRKPSRPPTGCRSTTSPCSTIESTALKAPWRTSCSPWSRSMTEGRHPA